MKNKTFRLLILLLLILVLFLTKSAPLEQEREERPIHIYHQRTEVYKDKDGNIQDEIKLELEEMEVCNNSSVKTYMDYKAITNTSSKQYAIIRDHLEVSNGYLYDKDGYMAVALGSYWGDIGDRFIFYLDSGIELKVIKTDRKADHHVWNGCQQRWDTSVIEIIIDGDTLPYNRQSNGYYFFGNFNNNPEFTGKIERVYRVIE